MKKLLRSEICGTREQCTGALFTKEKSKHAAEGKKKGRKTRKCTKRKRAVYPNGY